MGTSRSLPVSPTVEPAAARAPGEKCALVLAAGLCLVAIAANQTAVHWRVNVVDSDLFAWHGWCVAEGARPYLEIWDNKPPGIWWVNAAAIAACGPGSRADMLLGTAALALTLLGCVGVARMVYGPALVLPASMAAAVLLTHAGLECGSNRTETFVTACETGTMLGYAAWRTRGGRRWLVLSGLCAGAAPLFKQSGAAAGLACALHLAWGQWRGGPAAPRRGCGPWITFIAAGLVAPLAAGAVLAGAGALGAAWFAIGVFNRAYFEVGDATWWRMDQAVPHFAPVLARLSGALLIAGLGLVAAAVSAWRRARGPAGAAVAHAGKPALLGLFMTWLVLAFYLASVAPGRRGHHLMPALPPLALLVASPLHLLAGGATLGTRLTQRPSLVIVLVLWMFILVGTALDSVGEARQGWRAKPHWAALERSVPTPAERQGWAVAGLTRPDEVIYVWGWSPGTYRYAARRPASRFATLEKLGQVGDRAQFIFDAAVADVRRTEPAVMVISEADRPRLSTERPHIGEWIAAEYEEVDVIEGMILLRRRMPRP